MKRTELTITVIICSHNPRKAYLERVLAGLKDQTLPLFQWEVLIIDNSSDQPLSLEFDLSWHPSGRHIFESELGLTKARLRGIREALADILVFVDDDNVLDPDYLENIVKISKKWPILGAWGGQIRPEFEQEPPDWTRRYWGLLAIREFNTDKWSNLIHQHQTTPCGAGLCVRKKVADEYIKLLQQDPLRTNLDRKGNLLYSCGDSDLAFTACDIGLGTGQFTSLKLTHIIPSSRLEEDYLLKLVEEMSYSSIILSSFRDGEIPQANSLRRLLQKLRRWGMNKRDRRFANAEFRGAERARKELTKDEKS